MAETTDDVATATRDRRRLAVIACWAVAGIVAFVLYWNLSTPEWFGIDDWDPLATRSLTDLESLLRSHYGHPSIAVTVVHRTVLAVAGLVSGPAQALAILFHVAACVVVYRIVRAAGVRVWLACVAGFALVFFAAGYESITYTFGMTFSASLAFGLTGALCAIRLDRRRGLILAVALNFVALTWSSVGVTTTVVTALALVLVRRWRAALAVAVPLGGLYALWFVTVDQTSSGTRSSEDLVPFVRVHLWETFRHLAPGVLVFAVIALALVGLVATRAINRSGGIRPGAALEVAMAGGALFFLVTTALARSGLEVFTSDWPVSRYMHATAVLLMPLVAQGAEQVVRWQRLLAVPVAAVLLSGIPSGFDHLVTSRDVINPPMAASARTIQMAPRLPELDDFPADVQVDPSLAPGVTMGWLREQLDDGALPTPRGMDEAEAGYHYLRVAAQPVPDVLSPDDRPFCRRVDGGLRLTVPTGAAVAVLGGAVEVTTEFRGVRSSPASWPGNDEFPVLYRVLDGPLDLELSVPDGGVSNGVCLVT